MITDWPTIGLAPTETALLAWADAQERHRLTVDDAASLLGRPRAYRVVSSLARKGLLTRVGPGIYLTRPLRALGRQQTPTGLAQVALLLGDEPYYVGGRSAASLHHLTPQRFHALIDLYTDAPIHSRHLGTARLVVHPLPRVGLVEGIVTTTARDIPVRISDLERTVVDLIDRMDRLLGWKETQQLVHDAVLDERVDVARLVRYAVTWPKRTTAARVGALLERAGVDIDRLAPLITVLAPSATQTVLVPGQPRRGPWDPRFRVILNDRAMRQTRRRMESGA